jgi:hypothetical protein
VNRVRQCRVGGQEICTGDHRDRLACWDTVAAMSDEPSTPKLQVQIDEDVAQGVYSNLVLLNHTENEFVLDFAFIQPSNGRAKVRSRVISSPRHTKRLLQALQKNLERYEERFGTIDISSDDDPVFH